MKKLAIITLLLMLIAGICFAAASDYKVDNNGNIYGYGLHILTTGTFLNILSGSAYFQTPLGISSGGTGTNVAISMVNSFNTRTGVVSLTATDVSSVYTGSTNLTILGTIATGTVPYSHVSSVPISNSTTTGVLTGTDWTTFNNKLATNGSGSALTGITYSQLTGTPISNSTTTGMLIPTDWSTFNNKLATNGNGSSLTGLTYSQLTGTPISNASTTGMLTGTDWTTFNAKQSALNGAYVASFNSSTGNVTTPTVNDTNVTLSMASGQTQTLTAGWTGTLADGRIASAATWNAKQNALTGSIAGTTNQVSVTANSNSISSGTITLSTPQNLDTTATTTWGALYSPTLTSTGTLTLGAGGSNNSVVTSPTGTGFTILNGNVGIGTTNPQGLLSLKEGNVRIDSNSSSGAGINVFNYTSSSAQSGYIAMRKSRGTDILPSQVLSGDFTLQLTSYGYGSTGYHKCADIWFIADQDFTDSASGSSIQFRTTNLNSTSSTEKMRISSTGDLLINTTSELTNGGKLQVVSGTTTSIGAIIRGASSQTADLQEWQKSDGTVYSSVSATGVITAPQYFVSALNTAPTSSVAACATGEIRFTSGAIYLCTAINTWVRSVLSTW